MQAAGRLDAAEASYRRVIVSVMANNDEWVLWAYLGMGDIEREHGRLEDALANYQTAVAIAENSPRSIPAMPAGAMTSRSPMNASAILIALGNYPQALQHCQAQKEALSGLVNGDPGGSDPQRDRAASPTGHPGRRTTMCRSSATLQEPRPSGACGQSNLAQAVAARPRGRLRTGRQSAGVAG